MSLGHLCWDNTILDLVKMKSAPSPETQGQIKGARDSLNGRKNLYGTKKSKERKKRFLAPIRSQNGGDRLELVWWDIVPRGSSRRSLLFFVPYFPARLDFPSSPLFAPVSPKMSLRKSAKLLSAQIFYPCEKLSCDVWITMAPGIEEAVATLNERHVHHSSLRLNLTQN